MLDHRSDFLLFDVDGSLQHAPLILASYLPRSVRSLDWLLRCQLDQLHYFRRCLRQLNTVWMSFVSIFADFGYPFSFFLGFGDLNLP